MIFMVALKERAREEVRFAGDMTMQSILTRLSMGHQYSVAVGEGLFEEVKGH